MKIHNVEMLEDISRVKNKLDSLSQCGDETPLNTFKIDILETLYGLKIEDKSIYLMIYITPPVRSVLRMGYMKWK